MAETFDPYYKWLGIPPEDQPPHHYRLLGLNLFESDPDVIDAAANQRMGYLQACAHGPHIALTQQLLNEIATARVCLLNPERRADYDNQLRQRLGQSEASKTKRGSQAVPEMPTQGRRRDTGSAATNPPQPPAEPGTFLPPDDVVAPVAKVAAPAAKVAASPAKAAAPQASDPETRSAVSTPAASPRRSNVSLVIAAVAAVLLLGGIAVWLATSGGGSDPSANLEGVVLDDAQAEAHGNWERRTDGSPIGPHYLIDDGQGGANTIQFFLDSLRPGYYRVRLAYVPGEDRATNATVYVIQGGRPQAIKVDQQQSPDDGRFHNLGTFHFTGSSKDAIQISATGADGRVAVDAVQFIKD